MDQGRMGRLMGALVLAAVCLAPSGCGIISRQAEKVVDYQRHVGDFGRYGRLSDVEMGWAKAAWSYFQNNTNPENGLVNGYDRFPLFSMWHLADTLAALAAARDLGIIEEREFDERLSRLLNFLNTMDLSESSFPNRLYNSATGKMVNEENKPADIGWSAVDTGRLLTWMKIIGLRYPQYREYLDKAVLRWNFCQAIDDCGTLYAISRSKGQRKRSQEGRLGYEQAAAAGFAAWGFDASHLWRPRDLGTISLQGAPVPYDTRDPRDTGVPAPVVTMPYILLGMEYGWQYPGGAVADKPLEKAAEPAMDMGKLALQVFAAQENRYEKQGVLTARTDFQMREPPLTVIDAVFNAGTPWSTTSPDGKDQGKYALVSTRAAFGLWALWPSKYTDRLIQAVQALNKPDKGWYEGRLEKSGGALETVSLSTNAMVLEALLFKVRGQLYPKDSPPGYFQRRVFDVFNHPGGQCLPPDRQACRSGKVIGGKKVSPP